MSGSPGIQDSELVGAVTHVPVNDPTTGCGIFIENMLGAAAYTTEKHAGGGRLPPPAVTHTGTVRCIYISGVQIMDTYAQESV